MNLEQHIRERFTSLNDTEEVYETVGITGDMMDNYIEKERDSLRRLQFLMYLAMKEQYPEETSDQSIDMFDKYTFEIKVSKK